MTALSQSDASAAALGDRPSVQHGGRSSAGRPRRLTALHWPIGAIVAAACAAVPPLAAWMIYGALIVTDSYGYLEYAAAMRHGTIAAGSALLHEAAVQVTLFRMGGYPMVLAGLQVGFGQEWPTALVTLQICGQATVAALAFQAGLALGLPSRRAMIAAVLPAFGFTVVLQLCVLTDALYGALVSGAALLLVAKPNMSGLVVAAMALAAATAIREATVFLAIGYLPLAFISAGPPLRRRVAATALIFALSWGVAATQIAWNVSRGAGYVLTTSPQTVLVQAVLPLVKAGLPVFDGDGTFDTAARASLEAGEYVGIDELHRRLFAEGMTPVGLASAASSAYWRTWRRFPLAMLGTALANLRPRYLAMPLQPLETISDLVVFAGGGRPTYARFDDQWRLLRHGQLAAGVWVGLDLVTRMIGVVVSLAALVGPWQRARDARCRGLWCVGISLIAIYAPVHLEPRYLAPLTPLMCLLAMVTLQMRLRAPTQLDLPP